MQPPELDVLGDESGRSDRRYDGNGWALWRGPWTARRRWMAAGLALVVVAAIATALVLTQSEPERRLAWSALPAPPVPADTVLSAISCPGPDECWVAGTIQAFFDPEGRGYLAHWSGGAWSVVSDSSVTNLYTASDVSCRARDDCWAASGTRFAFGSFHYDGERWRLAPPERAADGGYVASIQQVECRAGGVCVASVAGDCQTRPAVWDGSRWRQAPGYDTATPCLSTFSCSSVTDCDGFGFPTRDGGQPLRFLTRGGTWTTAPFTTTRDYNDSRSSCPDAGSCVAVFATLLPDHPGTEVVMIDDDTRTDPAVANRGLPPSLWSYDVTCTSMTHCFLVGANPELVSPAPTAAPTVVIEFGENLSGSIAGADGTLQPALYQWTGQQWVSSPLPAVRDGGLLNRVACTSATLCWAIGIDADGQPIVLKGTPE